MIANNDRAGLREYADRVRTLYETLSSINALDKMNMTNLGADESKTSDNSSDEVERERSTNSRTKTES